MATLGSATMFSNRISRLMQVACWHDDCSTAETLMQVLRDVSFSTHEGGAMIALPVARLRDTVDETPGMMMNERLVSLDLLNRWDRSVEAQRTVLCGKLLVRQ